MDKALLDIFGRTYFAEGIKNDSGIIVEVVLQSNFSILPIEIMVKFDSVFVSIKLGTINDVFFIVNP